MVNLAIIAGRGLLPKEIYRMNPDAFVVSFQSVGIDFECENQFETEFEKFGGLVKTLRARGIEQVCFAGAMTRPAFNLRRLDAKTLILLPKIKKAMANSDGVTLRFVRQLFEDEGFEIVGAHNIAPDLLMPPSLLTSTSPTKTDIDSAENAKMILKTVGGFDIGQGLVMRNGQCFAIETLPGTKAMLEFCAQNTDENAEPSGYLLKASKPNQDLDIDMPTIGPLTIEEAHRARLKGLFLEAGRVICLEKEETIARANRYEMFIEGVKL